VRGKPSKKKEEEEMKKAWENVEKDFNQKLRKALRKADYKGVGILADYLVEVQRWAVEGLTERQLVAREEEISGWINSISERMQTCSSVEWEHLYGVRCDYSKSTYLIRAALIEVKYGKIGN